MFFAIFSGAFLVVAALAILFGVLKGRRKIWQVSVSRIILTVVAALLSTVVALCVSWIALDVVANSLINGVMLGDVDISALIDEVPSLMTAALAIVSMLITPILFLIAYAIIRPIAAAFVKPLARLIAAQKSTTVDENGKKHRLTRAEKNARLKLEKGHWLSAIIGGFSGLLTLCVLLVPLVGALGIVNDIALVPLTELAEQEPDLEVIPEIVDASANNVGTVTVKCLGGGLLYDLMTTYPVEGGFATLKHESRFISSVANAAITLSDESASTEQIKADLNGVSEAFDRSVLLPTVAADFVSSAADDWSQGQDFCGVEAPELGDEELQPVVNSLLEGFKQSNVDTIKTDIKTIVDIFVTLLTNDVLDNIEADPMSVLSEEEITAELIKLLLDNPRLNVAVDGIADYGMGLLLDTLEARDDKSGLYDEFLEEFSMVDASSEAPMHSDGSVPVPTGEEDDEMTVLKEAYAEIFDAYGIRIDDASTIQAAAEAKRSGADMKSWVKATIEGIASAEEFNAKTELITASMITDGRAEITDTAAEAKNLAHAFAIVSKVMDDMDGDELDLDSILDTMGDALDEFKNTQTIGAARTAYILKAIFQSELVRDEVGLSILDATDTANKIVVSVERTSYKNIINTTIKDTIEFAKALANPDEDLGNAINKLVDNLTPESAGVMQSMITESTVQSSGVPEQSSKQVTNLIGDMFGNLSDLKQSGADDEQVQKETEAIKDMVNLMQSANSSDGSDLFGDENSVTGKTMEDYLDTVMDTSAMSQSIVANAYDEKGNLKSNPLNYDRVATQGEKEEFAALANEKWNEMSQDKKNDGSGEKELAAIGTMINMNIVLVDGEWVVA